MQRLWQYYHKLNKIIGFLLSITGTGNTLKNRSEYIHSWKKLCLVQTVINGWERYLRGTGTANGCWENYELTMVKLEIILTVWPNKIRLWKHSLQE